MTRWLIFVLAVWAMGMVAGCFAPQETPAPAADMATEVVARPDTTVQGGEDEAGTGELVGTTWQVGEFIATFYEPPDVLLKGGRINETHPEGVMGTYTIEDGIIEVGALDQSRVGTFDGARLVIDGIEGVKL